MEDIKQNYFRSKALAEASEKAAKPVIEGRNIVNFVD